MLRPSRSGKDLTRLVALPAGSPDTCKSASASAAAGSERDLFVQAATNSPTRVRPWPVGEREAKLDRQRERRETGEKKRPAQNRRPMSSFPKPVVANVAESGDIVLFAMVLAITFVVGMALFAIDTAVVRLANRRTGKRSQSG